MGMMVSQNAACLSGQSLFQRYCDEYPQRLLGDNTQNISVKGRKRNMSVHKDFAIYLALRITVHYLFLKATIKISVCFRFYFNSFCNT